MLVTFASLFTNRPKVLAVAYTAIALVTTSVVIRFPAYRRKVMNNVTIGTRVLGSFTCLCGLLTALINDPENDAPAILLYLGWLALLIAAANLAVKSYRESKIARALARLEAQREAAQLAELRRQEIAAAERREDNEPKAGATGHAAVQVAAATTGGARSAAAPAPASSGVATPQETFDRFGAAESKRAETGGGTAAPSDVVGQQRTQSAALNRFKKGVQTVQAAHHFRSGLGKSRNWPQQPAWKPVFPISVPVDY